MSCNFYSPIFKCKKGNFWLLSRRRSSVAAFQACKALCQMKLGWRGCLHTVLASFDTSLQPVLDVNDRASLESTCCRTENKWMQLWIQGTFCAWSEPPVDVSFVYKWVREGLRGDLKRDTCMNPSSKYLDIGTGRFPEQSAAPRWLIGMKSGWEIVYGFHLTLLKQRGVSTNGNGTQR